MTVISWRQIYVQNVWYLNVELFFPVLMARLVLCTSSIKFLLQACCDVRLWGESASVGVGGVRGRQAGKGVRVCNHVTRELVQHFALGKKFVWTLVEGRGRWTVSKNLILIIFSLSQLSEAFSHVWCLRPEAEVTSGKAGHSLRPCMKRLWHPGHFPT